MRKRGILLFVFLFFLVLSIGSYFLFQTAFAQKSHGLTESLLLPFERLFIGFYPKNTSDFASLREENRRLREQLAKKALADQDVLALRDQFQVQTVTSRNLLPARIVGMRTFIPGITYPEEITLDKGTKDNVKKGTNVIVGETLIAQVTHVTEKMAKVTLLTAPSSSVSVETQNSSALGILRGRGNGAMRLENVLLSDKLEKNDSVVTKGEQETDGVGYQQGLFIGKITSVSKKASDLFQSADVEAALTIPKVSTVFLIITE